MVRIRVDLGERSYDVVVGRNVLDDVRQMLPPESGRVAIVTQEGIPRSLVPPVGDRATSVHLIDDGEEHKTLGTIERLCGEFSRAGLGRADAVVAVGGGMVTDVAGFAAAVYHRGIAVIHVATSLLGMIDAAVGGKTGVNLPEGKNLAGAFWQPRGVVCDISALDSLPEREIRCGAGEMAKYHFIAREDLSTLPLESRIARCIEIKARIVGLDEREGGRRALLNYGHTLAHALEIETKFSMAHGEAVALGVLFAAEVAHLLGRIEPPRVNEHYRVVREVYGLNVELPDDVGIESLLGHMARDKKALAGLTFVLDSSDGLEVVPNIDPEVLRAAYGVLSRKAIS